MTTPRRAHLLPQPSKHPGRDVRMGELAEWMAENGGRIRDAAKALGWPYDHTKQVWRRIIRRMGPQAV
jgi:molybdenum-dependent DNA-binding transcriptional regulator ModE